MKKFNWHLVMKEKVLTSVEVRCAAIWFAFAFCSLAATSNALAAPRLPLRADNDLYSDAVIKKLIEDGGKEEATSRFMVCGSFRGRRRLAGSLLTNSYPGLRHHVEPPRQISIQQDRQAFANKRQRRRATESSRS